MTTPNERGTLRIVDAGPTVMATGDAGPFSAPDYLQLAAMAKRSVVVEQFEADSLVGAITVLDGEAYSAVDAQGEGVAAFRRMALRAQDGTVRLICRALEGEPPRRNLTGSLEQLLLEAAREADERDGAAPSSAVDSADVSPSRAPSPSRPPVPRPNPRTNPGPISAEDTSMPTIPLRPGVDLPALLRRTPDLQGIATCSADGTVEHTAGKLDADMLCAVVAMAHGHVLDATDELGLGAARSWWLSSAVGCWYVVSMGAGFIVALSETTKNPESLLKAIAEGGKR